MASAAMPFEAGELSGGLAYGLAGLTGWLVSWRADGLAGWSAGLPWLPALAWWFVSRTRQPAGENRWIRGTGSRHGERQLRGYLAFSAVCATRPAGQGSCFPGDSPVAASLWCAPLAGPRWWSPAFVRRSLPGWSLYVNLFTLCSYGDVMAVNPPVFPLGCRGIGHCAFLRRVLCSARRAFRVTVTLRD